jgi:hypothetical protein
MKNTTRNFQSYGDIIWFPLGVYVLAEGSIVHNTTENTISITAQDKMCLFAGDVAGQLQAPVELHRASIWNDTTKTYDYQEILVYDIIKNAVIKLGGENPGKVIITDVPLEYKVPMKYTGKTNLYFDINGNILTNVSSEDDPRINVKVLPGGYAGYQLQPFYYPKDLVKNAGDTIISILDDIKNTLGNFEYFYDIEGNFIFQEVKNYMNTSFTPLVELTNGDYIADFTKLPNVYSFKDKDLVQSFNNSPDWKNIKNDFVVWGTKSGGGAMMYHLAIDEKPNLPADYTKPWQQYLVELGDADLSDPGRYYEELKAKLPQIYTAATNTWNADPASYLYYFDLIDTKSDLGKFSVSTLGRRTKTVVDENVSVMYPPDIPDIVLLPTGTSQESINHLISIGQKFVIINSSDYSNIYTVGAVGKDAFTVIREMLWKYTTFNEVVTLNCMPIYFLDANNRVEIEDKRSSISGDYIIKSFSLPLGSEGLMSINATRVSSRI